MTFTPQETKHILQVKTMLESELQLHKPTWLLGTDLNKYLVITDSNVVSRMFHGINSRMDIIPIYMLDMDNRGIWGTDWSSFFAAKVEEHKEKTPKHKILRNLENKNHHEEALYVTSPNGTSSLLVPTKFKTRQELVENVAFLHGRPSYQDGQFYISRDMYDSIAKKTTVRMNETGSMIMNTVPSNYSLVTMAKFHAEIKKKVSMFSYHQEAAT